MRLTLGRVGLFLFLCVLAGIIAVPTIDWIDEYMLVAAQKTLSATAHRMLPEMQKQAYSIALSLRESEASEGFRAPTPFDATMPSEVDTKQFIEFPFLLYEFQYDLWKEDAWSKSVKGPWYVSGARSHPLALEDTARLAAHEKGGALSEAFLVDFFEEPELVKANPTVDVSQVKSFVIVFVDMFSSQTYDTFRKQGGLPDGKSGVTTSSLRVYAVDRASLKVTAFHQFRPDPLPDSFSSEYRAPEAISEREEGDMYSWLAGLRASTLQ